MPPPPRPSLFLHFNTEVKTVKGCSYFCSVKKTRTSPEVLTVCPVRNADQGFISVMASSAIKRSPVGIYHLPLFMIKEEVDRCFCFTTSSVSGSYLQHYLPNRAAQTLPSFHPLLIQSRPFYYQNHLSAMFKRQIMSSKQLRGQFLCRKHNRMYAIKVCYERSSKHGLHA